MRSYKSISSHIRRTVCAGRLSSDLQTENGTPTLSVIVLYRLVLITIEKKKLVFGLALYSIIIIYNIFLQHVLWFFFFFLIPVRITI